MEVEGPPISAEAHRAAARQFASGVTVAAAAHRGRAHAITATAFCSLSVDPPLVLLAVRTEGQLLPLIEGSGCFGVSVLAGHQRHVGEWAATPGRGTERTVAREATVTAVTGAPLVPEALAWFDCRLQTASTHGDHTVLTGLVVAAHSRPGDGPLLYFRGTYHELGPAVEPAPSRTAPSGDRITIDDEVGGGAPLPVTPSSMPGTRR